jgi:hypothetical protein
MQALQAGKPAAVVTASRSQAYFLRRRLIAENRSLLGVQFLSPSQLRELMLRDRDLHVPLRKHLRLLLAVAADGFAAQSDLPEPVLIASSIARDPDAFLRTLEQLGTADETFQNFDSLALREISGRFQSLVADCGFTFVYEGDRIAARDAGKLPPLFDNLLVAGFDGSHWPLWPLLHAGASSSSVTTVVLTDPRDEARDLDETWIATWEEEFGEAHTIPASENDRPPAFEHLLGRTTSSLHGPEIPSSTRRNVHFFAAHDTTEQARTIAAVAITFLNEPSFERLAILLPGPGALARLVGSSLERLQIPHHDGIAHERRGAFDDEEWRAWLHLQEQPRLGALLHFLRQSPAGAAMFEPLSLQKVEDTLQRACGDILINGVEVLNEYCARRNDQKNYVAVAAGLSALSFLPDFGTFDDLRKQALRIFRSLKWRERAAELERLSGELANRFSTTVSRRNFLQWLSDIFAESSLARDPYGGHPYARVHLLRYDQAEGAIWSHTIFAGLNEGVWPPIAEESPFLSDELIATLNEKNRHPSRFGEGPRTVREGKTLCLGTHERRALAWRQLQNVIESTTQKIAVTANLHTYAPREQAINPSEFYAQLFFRARGQALSQREINDLHEQTQRWIERQEFLRERKPPDVDTEQTGHAYRARRTEAAFGEYEFSFRADTPPAEQAELSATDLANALKRPALIWIKNFLGVECDEIEEGSWNLATGQWVHRWLATIGAEPRQNRLVSRPADEEIKKRVVAAADDFKEELSSILANCGRPLPDWWRSGWRNARHLAEQFAAQVAAANEWPLIATEWKLSSPQRIAVENGGELRVRGRIDLILARDDALSESWIVDYKTGEAQPLKSRSSELRKQLIKGDGVQICIYLLALAKDGPRIVASLLTRNGELAPQISSDDLKDQKEIWSELASMQQSGIFGMLGELRSEFAFTGTYPLATLAVDKELLRQKWELTHPAFARPQEK